jgi:hypothetical protein
MYSAVDSKGRTHFEAKSLDDLEQQFVRDYNATWEEVYERPDIAGIWLYDEDGDHVELPDTLVRAFVNSIERRCPVASRIDGMTATKAREGF